MENLDFLMFHAILYEPSCGRENVIMKSEELPEVRLVCIAITSCLFYDFDGFF